MTRSRWFLIAIVVIVGAGVGLYTMYQIPRPKVRYTARHPEVNIPNDGDKNEDFYSEQKETPIKSAQDEEYSKKLQELEKMKEDIEIERKELESWKMSQKHEIDLLREEQKKERDALETDQRRLIDQDKAALEKQKVDLDRQRNEMDSSIRAAATNQKDRDITSIISSVPQVDPVNFQGMDGKAVHEKYPGITFLSTYKKQRFLDAIGPKQQPASRIDDVTAFEAEERFYGLVAQNHAKCELMRRMGNTGDGGWDLCVSAPYTPQNKGCLVYSFGINNDYTFDDAKKKKVPTATLR